MLKDWLFKQDSLTKSLTAASHGHFSVRLLRQYWGYPNLAEQSYLKIKTRRKALIREVELLCYDRPYVYARSIIPLNILQGKYRRLAHLGASSLGAVLFRDKTIKRAAMQVIKVSPQSIAGSVSVEEAFLWGRRSRFYISGRPLLVSEIFYPWIDSL